MWPIGPGRMAALENRKVNVAITDIDVDQKRIGYSECWNQTLEKGKK